MSKTIFLIPTTSRNCNYQNIEECYLMTIFYESIKKFNIENYIFLIGFDDDDDFYLKNIDNLKILLPNNFNFHFYKNYEKTYSYIVNQLAFTAIIQYDAEFLFLTADDLYFYELNFVEVFKHYIKSNNNFCLGHAVDKTNISFKHEDAFNQKYGICTHPFVHVNHVKYLGYFIHPSIKNWFCDNWITTIYRQLNKIIMTENFVIENKIYDKRYEPVKLTKNEFLKYINDSLNIIKKKLENNIN